MACGGKVLHVMVDFAEHTLICGKNKGNLLGCLAS